VSLVWHSAKQEHRQHLSAFSCTLPDHGYFDDEEGFVCHDYPWELEVQDFIRSLHPPAHTPEFLLLGYDEDGLAAVLAMRVAKFDRYALIQAVGVAQRVSGQRLSQEVIGMATTVMAKYDFRPDYLIEARIDPDNLAAKSAFTRAGYAMSSEGGRYESWTRTFARKPVAVS
jgi:hypothetical protein